MNSVSASQRRIVEIGLFMELMKCGDKEEETMKGKKNTERRNSPEKTDLGEPAQRTSQRRETRQNTTWQQKSAQRQPQKRESEQRELRHQECESSCRIIGRNPVAEALKNGREIEKLILLRDGEGSLIKIEGVARDRGIPIQYADRRSLSRMAEGDNHQGVIAVAAPYRYWELDELIRHAVKQKEPPLLILLDGIEDPHNLGAILRTADAAGAHGVIIPKRRAAGLTETAVKASAGAAEYVPVARVPNLGQAIEQLKEAGLWICGCDMDGAPYDQAELTGGIGLVIGSEGRGVGRLIGEKCDFILSIPMCGQINSLNASNAAAVLMYEIRGQRRRQAEKTKG